MVNYTSISNDEAIRFLKRNNASAEQIAISNAQIWAGAIENEMIIGVCGVNFTKNTVRIKAFYVDRAYRGSGVGYSLVNYVINEDALTKEIFKHKPKATVFATSSSKGIFSKFGFKAVELRNNNITFMQRSNA